MTEPSAAEFVSSLRDVLVFEDGGVIVGDLKQFRAKRVDSLVYWAVFHSNSETRDLCRWLIRTIGLSAGVVPASIAGFYRRKGKGDFPKLTVPAFNVRGLTYDVARTLFRTAKANNSVSLIFEIARSEMTYTAQSPEEYATVVLGAALREGWTGPVFIQGDHFQFNSKRFSSDPTSEREALRALVKESIEAGFYNIDIDASTLVDLGHATLEEQQKVNCAETAAMTAFIREVQPEGIAVAVGGEIGEVGGKNSTTDELRVFLDGVLRELSALSATAEGLTKVSVQTGTTHGGIPLADGRVADVAIDFETLSKLSEMAIKAYRLAGAVQHGASTLPEESFNRFREVNTAEIHLATAFQNLIFDGGQFPKDLYAEICSHLRSACADERKPDQTEEQFFYKTRKKSFGPFKRKMWDLPQATRDGIMKLLQGRFDLIFKKLGAINTYDSVMANIELVKARPTLNEPFRKLVNL